MTRWKLIERLGGWLPGYHSRKRRTKLEGDPQDTNRLQVAEHPRSGHLLVLISF